MPGLFALLISFLGRFLTVDLLRFAATKALLSFLLFVGLSWVLRTFVLDMATELLGFQASMFNSTSLASPHLSLSGGIGWAANLLRVPDCISVLVAGYTVALMRSFIPFL